MARVVWLGIMTLLFAYVKEKFGFGPLSKTQGLLFDFLIWLTLIGVGYWPVVYFLTQGDCLV